jgi:benzodiazapine receptor
MRRVFSLVISFVIAFAAGYIGTLFAAPAIDTWYASLAKPALNPPNWVFAPAWSLLYACMALAAWRVWERRTDPRAQRALSVYGAQLIFNTLWSIVFFGLQSPLGAALVIIVLLALIACTAVLFYRIDAKAGYLFIPYIAWVLFATYLNISILIINR